MPAGRDEEGGRREGVDLTTTDRDTFYACFRGAAVRGDGGRFLWWRAADSQGQDPHRALGFEPAER